MESIPLMISLVSVVVSVIALVYSHRSSKASSLAADAARRSAEVAERSEARQTERNDVVWVSQLEKQDSDRTWVITNNGLDAALDVTAVVTVVNETLIEGKARVEPGESLRLDISDLSRAIHDRNRSRSRSAGPGVFVATSSKRPVTQRVVWCTPVGAWKVDVHGPEDVAL